MRVGIPVPRLLGFLALAGMAALEWGRQVDRLGAGRVGLWVGLAAAVGAVVPACDKLAPRARRPARLASAAAGLLAALPAAGLDAGLLGPRRWGELLDGLAGASESLVVVKLPYVGPDPWPGLALQLLGALLCVVAALLTAWPRAGRRGYPYFALAALMVLAATPVISLGGSRSVLFSGALAALTVCFLWLERLPLKPGFGITALVVVAFVGALPLAGAADREAPWFDVKGFAENVGTRDSARFDWRHSYGPIDWPRERREVLRVRVAGRGAPEYWKASTLDDFDGEGWVAGGSATSAAPVALTQGSAWTRSFDVSVRLLRSSDVIGPGAILDVSGAPRAVRPAPTAGRWLSESALRRGDRYRVRSYTPRPPTQELAVATSGARGRQADALEVRVPLRQDVPKRLLRRDADGLAATAAAVSFAPFGEAGRPRAQYLDPAVRGIGDDGAMALRRSAYARTWRLAQKLRRRARTPYEYVIAVDRHLHGAAFRYTERPAGLAYGVAPLDGFLMDAREGYCQHYSGAMALLLRMGGVPARVATGFSPGGYSTRRREWVVRDTDAHSWVEAWFDRFGWVTFDPTPGDTPARSQIASLAPSQRDSAGDTAASAGDASQERLGRSGIAAREDGGAGAGGTSDDASGSAGARGPIAWLVAALCLLLGVVALARVRRSPASRPPFDLAIAELEAAVRRTGRPAPGGTTLRQLELRFERSDDAVAYVRALRSARYSVKAEGPTAGQRRAVRRELARQAGRLGRLRALWALPPRVR